MSATGRGGTRIVGDAYYTPAWCVHRLLERVELPGGHWLEPAAGRGDIIEAVRSVRTDCTWDAWDVNPNCVPYLDKLGVNLAVRDALEYLEVSDLSPGYSVVFTNPPYGHAQAFVEKLLTRGAPRVVLLLRLGFLESGTRSGFLSEHVPDVYVLPNRPSFTGRGTDATAYGWLVWPTAKRRLRGKLEILATTPRSVRSEEKAMKKYGSLDGVPLTRKVWCFEIERESEGGEMRWYPSEPMTWAQAQTLGQDWRGRGHKVRVSSHAPALEKYRNQEAEKKDIAQATSAKTGPAVAQGSSGLLLDPKSKRKG